MAKNLSKDETSKQIADAFVIERVSTAAQGISRAEQAGHLLEELRKGYQALALRDQKQVKAFIRDCEGCSHFPNISRLA